MTRPTNHQEATMFVLHTTLDGQTVPLALVAHAHVDEEDGGVWCWMGHFQDATMEELTPGMILRDWLMWGHGNDQRWDWKCVKVNRVTARFENIITQEIATVRVDR